MRRATHLQKIGQVFEAQDADDEGAGTMMLLHLFIAERVDAARHCK